MHEKWQEMYLDIKSSVETHLQVTLIILVEEREETSFED